MKYKDIKILIAEDAKATKLQIMQLLNQLGFENFLAVDDGKVAIEKIKESLLEEDCFELIISDINMPQTNGIELLRWVRNTPETAHIPVMMLTAENEQDTVIEAIGAGANQYCIKPLELSVFKPKLVALLKKHFASL